MVEQKYLDRIRKGLKCPICGKAKFRNEFDINSHGIEKHNRPVMKSDCKEALELREAYSMTARRQNSRTITLSKKPSPDAYVPPRMSEPSSRGCAKQENRDT